MDNDHVVVSRAELSIVCMWVSTHDLCRHVFVPNFVGAKVGNVQITPENQPLIRTAYESRRPEELAVLSRCDVPTLLEIDWPNSRHMSRFLAGLLVSHRQ